jgi:hypothetical protein
MNNIVNIGNIIATVIFSIIMYWYTKKLLNRTSWPWIISFVLLYIGALAVISRRDFGLNQQIITTIDIADYVGLLTGVSLGTFFLFQAVLKGYVGNSKK